LPIAALRLAADVVVGLRRLGFETIAQLALRFGPEPGRRLDQLAGLLFEPIEPDYAAIVSAGAPPSSNRSARHRQSRRRSAI